MPFLPCWIPTPKHSYHTLYVSRFRLLGLMFITHRTNLLHSLISRRRRSLLVWCGDLLPLGILRAADMTGGGWRCRRWRSYCLTRHHRLVCQPTITGRVDETPLSSFCFANAFIFCSVFGDCALGFGSEGYLFTYLLFAPFRLSINISPTRTASLSRRHLSAGAWAGIVVGSGVVFLMILLLLVCLWGRPIVLG